MKRNSALKWTCYVLLPVFVLILIISIACIVITGNNEISSKEEYFKSDEFISTYIGNLPVIMNDLIFAQDDSYQTAQDGDYTIYYTNTDYTGNIKESYFIATYENKVYTNVMYSEETDTVQEIEDYITRKHLSTFNIDNGVYTSSEFSKEELSDYRDYLRSFYVTYYTKNEQTNTESDGNVYFIEATIDGNEIATESDVEGVEYHKAYFTDFTIHTAYTKEFEEDSYYNFYYSCVSRLKLHQNELYVMFPISAIMTLIMIVYLINAIGYTKQSNEININDFDKIFLEILIIIYFIILCVSCLILEKINFSVENINSIAIILVSLYALNFVSIEVICVSIVKRIKAKTFAKSSICGRIINIIIKALKWTKQKLVNAKNKLGEQIDITWKFIIFIVGCVIIAIGLILSLGVAGVVIDLIALVFITYKIILRINSFKKLENALKSVYEGNNKVQLYKDDFTPEFSKSVEYVNDISNGFKNAIEKSLKSERLKTELITNVSHDIKTPLTSIINYVDLIKEEETDNEKIKEYVGILDNKSQRLKRLIEDLVDASKASAGVVELKLEDINIIELIKQAIGEFEDKFEKKKLNIITDFPKNGVKIKADSRHMYRVIENLFSNISKYALEGSRVYIDTKVGAEKVLIEIKNISKERLNITEEELMQRFVRGDKSRTTEGSGLGLSIAKSLTELQGGRMECKIDGDLFKVDITFNIE